MGTHRAWLIQGVLLAAAVQFAAQARAQPRQVPGVLGGSVLLSVALPPGTSVREIEWSFSSGATIQVAEFSQSGFERPNPSDRFKQRLEMFNATALRIRALEPGDSGIYGARVILHPAVVQDQSFNLSIYEPLPDPEIQSWLLSETPAQCNVSLRCRVPSGTRATVTWVSPHGDPQGLRVRASGGGTLSVEVQPGGVNTTLSCSVRGVAEERRRSVDLQSVCWSGGEGIRLGRWTTMAAVILLGRSAWQLSP
ncbi:SLAM family member 8-like isoform X3 [Dromaius novaehollandiae]|uniref:SLAM family member 8-like isoform X3 n=1 Tax=Dromaius novaehollandiae TaxID=8790 RepID=UPI0031200179